MEINELKNKARDLVQVNIGQTLKFVIQHIKPENSTFDTLLNLNGRLTSFNSQIQNGLMTHEVRDIEENKIRTAVIGVINNISSLDIKSDETEALKKKITELNAEIQTLKSNSNNRLSVFKIQIDSNPKISDRPENYKCVYTIIDSETGETFEKESPLIKEAGFIIAVLNGIKSTYYIKLKISDRSENTTWESEHFLPILSKRTIKKITQ